MKNKPDSAATFARLAELLWGYGYQTRAAEHFEVAGRTVRRWIAGDATVPPRVMEQLRALVQIAPPPGSTGEADRDDACVDALDPGLTELRDRAVAAGWLPAEIAAAMLALVVSEIRANAGPNAVRETLDQILAQL